MMSSVGCLRIPIPTILRKGFLSASSFAFVRASIRLTDGLLFVSNLVKLVKFGYFDLIMLTVLTGGGVSYTDLVASVWKSITK